MVSFFRVPYVDFQASCKSKPDDSRGFRTINVCFFGFPLFDSWLLLVVASFQSRLVTLEPTPPPLPVEPSTGKRSLNIFAAHKILRYTFMVCIFSIYTWRFLLWCLCIMYGGIGMVEIVANLRWYSSPFQPLLAIMKFLAWLWNELY